MKKIVNGKMYNTETATCVGEFSSRHARNDFHFYAEKKLDADEYIEIFGEVEE